MLVYNDDKHLRQVYDLSHIQREIENFQNDVRQAGTKLAGGASVRNGGSAVRGNLSQYRYINTKGMLLSPILMTSVNKILDKININEHTLQHSILHLTSGQFLDWQDYKMWKSRCQVDTGSMTIGPVTNFFSISMTSNNTVHFKDDHIDVQKNHGILFKPSDIHAVKPTDCDRMWLVLGVASHIDLERVLK